MKRKVCKKCRIFVEKDVCPICKESNFTESWKGRLFILNPEKSEVAQKINIKNVGEYALKIR